MNKFYAAKLAGKSVDATVLKQTKLFAAVVTARSIGQKFPLRKLQSYWAQLRIPEGERCYAASTLQSEQYLVVQYTASLRQLLQLTQQAKGYAAQIEAATQREDLVERYLQLQKYMLLLICAINEIRTLTEMCVDHTLEVSNAASYLRGKVPEKAFFVQVLQQCGMEQDDAETQIGSYEESMRELASESAFLLLLLGYQVEDQFFPFNFSSLVHTRSNTYLNAKLCPFAAYFVLKEYHCLEKQRERERRFAAINAVYCILPVCRQSSLFDLYSATRVYVTPAIRYYLCSVPESVANEGKESPELGSKERQRPLALSTTYTAESDGTALVEAESPTSVHRKTQEDQAEVVSKKRLLRTQADSQSFCDAFLQANIIVQINEQLQERRQDGPPITEFKDFYKQFHISLVEEETLNAYCARQQEYITFKQNCQELEKIAPAYKEALASFQTVIEAKQFQKLEQLCHDVVPLIERARTICGRPVQLPTLKAGFDVLFLQFISVREYLPEQVLQSLDQAFLGMVEREGALQNKYQGDLELLRQNQMAFFSVRVDNRKTSNIYALRSQ